MLGLVDEGSELRAPLAEGKGTQVLAVERQQVVGADRGGIVGEQLHRDGAPVQPLLQHAERLHEAVAHDEQLAVEREALVRQVGQHLRQVGKSLGDVLAGPRVQPCREAVVGVEAARRLDADAVPLPLGGEQRRVLDLDVARLERMREHRGVEGRGVDRVGLVGMPLDPGEQVEVGRRQPVPDLLDLVCRLAAERRHRGLGEPCRDADAQRAGDELQERPAPVLVERVEPAGDDARQVELAGGRQRRDDVGEVEGLFSGLVFFSLLRKRRARLRRP